MDEEVDLLHKHHLGKHIKTLPARCARDDIHFLALLTKQDRKLLESHGYGLLPDGSPAYAPDRRRFFMKVRSSVRRICDKGKVVRRNGREYV